VIESINDTLKGQLDLERHGARTIAGVCMRFPPDRRGIDNEDRDAREADEVRPGVP